MTYGMMKGQGGFSGHPKLEGGDGGYLGHPVMIQQFPAKSVAIPQDDIPKGIIKPVKKEDTTVMQVQSVIPKLIIKTVKKEANPMMQVEGDVSVMEAHVKKEANPMMQVDGDVSVMGARMNKKKNTTIEGDIPKFTIKPAKEEEKTVTQVEGAVSVMKVHDASNLEYCDCCSEDEFPPDHYDK